MFEGRKVAVHVLDEGCVGKCVGLKVRVWGKWNWFAAFRSFVNRPRSQCLNRIVTMKSRLSRTNDEYTHDDEHTD